MSTRLCLALSCVLTAGTGCDVLTSTTSAVTVITLMPSLETAGNMTEQLIDVLPLDEIDQQFTGATVVVGQRSSALSTDAPTAITGADVSVTFGTGETKVELCEIEGIGGTYGATSLSTSNDLGCSQSSLEYVSDATYLTKIVTDSASYTTEITAPPAIDFSTVTFSPELGDAPFEGFLPQHPKNTELELDWSTTDASRHTFINLLRLEFTGNTSNPIEMALDVQDESKWVLDPNAYDTLPKTLEELLEHVLGPVQTTATIPADEFTLPGVYLIIITSAGLDTNTSDNLALGSGALAGSGSAFAFWVQ